MLIAILAMISDPVFAQTITGKVTSQPDGQPLAGVSVVVKGSGSGILPMAMGSSVFQLHQKARWFFLTLASKP